MQDDTFNIATNEYGNIMWVSVSYYIENSDLKRIYKTSFAWAIKLSSNHSSVSQKKWFKSLRLSRKLGCFKILWQLHEYAIVFHNYLRFLVEEKSWSLRKMSVVENFANAFQNIHVIYFLKYIYLKKILFIHWIWIWYI